MLGRTNTKRVDYSSHPSHISDTALIAHTMQGNGYLQRVALQWRRVAPNGMSQGRDAHHEFICFPEAQHALLAAGRVHHQNQVGSVHEPAAAQSPGLSECSPATMLKLCFLFDPLLH